MATTPAFYNTMHAENGVTAATANTNLDGVTGSYATVLTAASGGTAIEGVHADCQAAVTTGWIRFWRKKSSFTVLVHQERIIAQTFGEDVPTWSRYIKFYCRLASGWSLIASTYTGDDFNLQPDAKDL